MINTNNNKKLNIGPYYNLLLFKRHSNIFLVLSKKNGKHIATLTGGNCSLGRKKKEKKAVHNLSLMVKVLLDILNKAKINFLQLFIRQRYSGHYFNLCRLLKKNNIRIIRFFYVLKIPHGFRRSRKLRRI